MKTKIRNKSPRWLVAEFLSHDSVSKIIELDVYVCIVVQVGTVPRIVWSIKNRSPSFFLTQVGARTVDAVNELIEDDLTRSGSSIFWIVR